jgi:hypothetical protein
MTPEPPAEQRWALIRDFGNVDDAITEALERSAELRKLWDSQYTTAWWPNTTQFWEVFWARALEVLGVGPPSTDAAADREHAPPLANDRPGMKRRSGPLPTFHEPRVIEAALTELGKGKVKDASDASGLNAKDVLRIEKLQRWELLRPDGTADWERVWQRDGKIALRVLSSDRLEWIDPLPLRVRP